MHRWPAASTQLADVKGFAKTTSAWNAGVLGADVARFGLTLLLRWQDIYRPLDGITISSNFRRWYCRSF